jgi:hypothetical protein
MADAPDTHEALTEAEHRTQLLRAVISSTIGTTIEWYCKRRRENPPVKRPDCPVAPE